MARWRAGDGAGEEQEGVLTKALTVAAATARLDCLRRASRLAEVLGVVG
jgi:hypothetical protein